MEKTGYYVTFREIDDPEGTVTMLIFIDEDDFKKHLRKGNLKNKEVVGRGLTEADALKACSESERKRRGRNAAPPKKARRKTKGMAGFIKIPHFLFARQHSDSR